MLHINVLELKAVNLALLTFKKQRSLKAVQLSNRQHHSTTLLCEIWGRGGPNVTEIKQRNLAATPDHNYCRITSKFFEYGGRLVVLKQQGPIRMETLPKSISASLPEEGNAQNLFATRLSYQLPQYFAWKLNSFSQGTDALLLIWCNQFLYAFPPFFLILRPNRELLLVPPTWQSQIWYPLLLEMSIVRPLLLPRNTSLINPQGKVLPLIVKRTLQPAVSTVSGKGVKKGVSETAAQLITSTRQKISRSNYNS